MLKKANVSTPKASILIRFILPCLVYNARQFFESPALVEIRKQAGVKAPNFI